MKRNIGLPDRIIRLIVAISIIALYFAHIINGALAILLLCVAVISLVTSFTKFCPLYAVFGISTDKKIKQ